MSFRVLKLRIQVFQVLSKGTLTSETLIEGFAL